MWKFVFLQTLFWRPFSHGEVIKGLGYAPVPIKADDTTTLPLDDFMSEDAKPLWGPRGRGDLSLMKALGANAVRLYGNDPRQDHTSFLNEAKSNGLHVLPGMSDYPFSQMDGNCMTTSYNCYSQLKDAYLGNLENGWLQSDRSYHPAIRSVVVINEPELKLPSIDYPSYWLKALLSAIDGVLSAEQEANVTGSLVNLTVTFSFAYCYACSTPSVGHKPGLDMMVALRDAFLSPEDYGYTPINDLTAFFHTRFVNSFNSANPASTLSALFFDHYAAEFPSTPVFQGEFHCWDESLDQTEEIATVLAITESLDLFQGIYYFEWQVRYDKGASELYFGMFGLGEYSLGTFDFHGTNFEAWCLVPITRGDGPNVPSAVFQSFGGSGYEADKLCLPDPEKVPLTEAGYALVVALDDVDSLADLVARVVRHGGGTVTDDSALATFAASGAAQTLSSLRASLHSGVAWASFLSLADGATCHADRASDLASVGSAIEKVCASSGFDCATIPSQCSTTVWLQADYVLSVAYQAQAETGDGDALTYCYYDGSAEVISVASYSTDPLCVVTQDATYTPVTAEGYQAVLKLNDPTSTKVFIRRVVEENLNAVVASETSLSALAADPPASYTELLAVLDVAVWVCTSVDGSQDCAGSVVDAPITDAGFRLVVASGNVTSMMAFLEVVVAHHGGQIADKAAFRSFAAAIVSDSPTFETAVAAVATKKSWAYWSNEACTLVSNSSVADVGLTIEYACSKTWFNCANLPDECSSSTYHSAEYVLSVYYQEQSSPLPTCYYNGGLIFARVASSVGSSCVVTKDGATTPLTDEGLQAVVRSGDVAEVATFLRRVVEDVIGGLVIDLEALEAFVSDPPSSLYDAEQLLADATWVCTGDVAVCYPDEDSVSLTNSGYKLIAAQLDAARLRGFLRRVIAFYEGQVLNETALETFAETTKTFSEVTAALNERPYWIAFGPVASCLLLDRNEDASVGLTLEAACSQSSLFDCASIPSECGDDSWLTARYALSALRAASSGSSLGTCERSGSLVFAQAQATLDDASCFVSHEPAQTALTEEGYAAVKRLKDAGKMQVLLERLIESSLSSRVIDVEELQKMAENPPNSVPEALAELAEAAWLCSSSSAACSLNPSLATLEEESFEAVLADGGDEAVTTFGKRIVEHYGGEVTDESAMLSAFRSSASLATFAASVAQGPTWAPSSFANSTCFAREDTGLAGSLSAKASISQACAAMEQFDCDDIPTECLDTWWDALDYILSVRNLELGFDASSEGSAALSCVSGGQLVFTSPRMSRPSGSPNCLVSKDGSVSALTSEGYQATLASASNSSISAFIRRAAAEQLLATVLKDSGINSLLANPPASYLELLAALYEADWLSIGALEEEPSNLENGSSGTDEDFLSWRMYFLYVLGGIVGLAVVISALYVWSKELRSWQRKNKSGPATSKPPSEAPSKATVTPVSTGLGVAIVVGEDMIAGGKIEQAAL